MLTQTTYVTETMPLQYAYMEDTYIYLHNHKEEEGENLLVWWVFTENAKSQQPGKNFSTMVTY